jgi:hypothetical protein
MRAWGMAVATFVVCLGVEMGVAGPETTPVDPAPFIGQGDGPGGRGQR